MDLKKWLERAKNIDEELKVLEQSKRNALGNAVYTSPTFEQAVQKSRDNSSEKKSAAYTDYVNQLEFMQTKLLKTRQEVAKAISALEDTTDRAILLDYYINNKSFAQIARERGYEVSTVYKRRDKAVEKLEGKLL